MTLTCIWPTFLGSNAKSHRDNFIFPSPIYTQFDPVMHPTIALDKFEDELPWPTFDILFQVAMQNLVSEITSDFLHRFTHNLNLGGDEFQHEWPWPTFDLLFQIAMNGNMRQTKLTHHANTDTYWFISSTTWWFMQWLRPPSSWWNDEHDEFDYLWMRSYIHNLCLVRFGVTIFR